MAAGKKKTAPASTAVSPEVEAQVQDLKKLAQTHFLGKSFSSAIDAYNQAIKLLGDAPEKAPEKAELLLKTANCYLIEKKFKEAIKACGATLDQQPTSIAALKTRAKAYEQLGFFKQALGDAEAINKGEGASGDTLELERRLKAAMSANKAKLAGSQGTGAPRAESKTPFPYTITVKATLDDETRVMTASIMVTYADLLEAIKAKFPNAGPFVLKYVDKEGDSVTITSRNNIHAYMGELMQQYQRQMQSAAAPKASSSSLPPMRIQVVKVSSEAMVPKPPADELQHQLKVAEAAKEEQPKAQPYETHDDWLVEFARLFSEITGIEPVAHHEHISLGNEKLTRAMEVPDEEQAQPLFEKASEHFRDATCASFIQWGNIHIIRADRQGQALLKAGKALEGKSLDAILKEYDEAEKKYNEALKLKADAWEANGSLGQLEWERAKARLGYIVPTPPVADLASLSDNDESKEDAAAAVKVALGKLDPKKVGQVQKYVDGSTKWFEQAVVLAKAAEEKKKAEEESEAAPDAEKEELSAEQQQQQQLQSPSGNMYVMHGNILYEWSQVLAAINKDWKPVLDLAVAKFRAAGAAEADIRGALKGHYRKEELDLGEDPEPEAAAGEPATQAKDEKAKAPAPEAKGLPSLEVKKKTKAAA